MYMLSIMLIILITDHVEIKFREMKVEKKVLSPSRDLSKHLMYIVCNVLSYKYSCMVLKQEEVTCTSILSISLGLCFICTGGSGICFIIIIIWRKS